MECAWGRPARPAGRRQTGPGGEGPAPGAQRPPGCPGRTDPAAYQGPLQLRGSLGQPPPSFIHSYPHSFTLSCSSLTAGCCPRPGPAQCARASSGHPTGPRRRNLSFPWPTRQEPRVSPHQQLHFSPSAYHAHPKARALTSWSCSQLGVADKITHEAQAGGPKDPNQPDCPEGSPNPVIPD